MKRSICNCIHRYCLRIKHFAGVFKPRQIGADNTLCLCSFDVTMVTPCTGGHVALVSLKSRQLAGTLKMNGTARTAAFSPDGTELLTLGAPQG